MSIWRESMNERRPDYILAIRAQALDRVQELIEPHENDDIPPPDVWRRIVDAAFPPPPTAGRVSCPVNGAACDCDRTRDGCTQVRESIFSAQRALDEFNRVRRLAKNE